MIKGQKCIRIINIGHLPLVCITTWKYVQNKYDKRLSLEFKNEILTLSMIEHLNLVRLYGYLEHGDEQMILVEYISNGTLREHLDGKSSNNYL